MFLDHFKHAEHVGIYDEGTDDTWSCRLTFFTNLSSTFPKLQSLVVSLSGNSCPQTKELETAKRVPRYVRPFQLLQTFELDVNTKLVSLGEDGFQDCLVEMFNAAVARVTEFRYAPPLSKQQPSKAGRFNSIDAVIQSDRIQLQPKVWSLPNLRKLTLLGEITPDHILVSPVGLVDRRTRMTIETLELLCQTGDSFIGMVSSTDIYLPDVGLILNNFV